MISWRDEFENNFGRHGEFRSKAAEIRFVLQLMMMSKSALQIFIHSGDLHADGGNYVEGAQAGNEA